MCCGTDMRCGTEKTVCCGTDMRCGTEKKACVVVLTCVAVLRKPCCGTDVCVLAGVHGALLVTCININPSMDK